MSGSTGRVALARRSRTWLPHAIVLAVFVASRLFYRYVLDVSFDPRGPSYFIQYVPATLLRDHFWQSLFHLHHQAPLPSFLVGLDAFLEPSRHFVALDALFLGLGAFVAVALVDIALRLGVRTWLAVLATTLFVVQPSTVIYEAWLFYPHLVASLLVMSLHALLGYVRSPSFARGSWFFATLGLVAFTRSTYGLVFIGAMLAISMVLLPKARKTTLAAALLPMTLVGALSLKTRLDTGASAGDALLWPNLVFKTWYSMNAIERSEADAAGRLSPLVTLEPMAPLADMRAHGIAVSTPPRGIPLFDEAVIDGQINYHSLGYLRVAEQYAKRDAIHLVRRHRAAYVRSVVYALTTGTAQSSLDDMVLGDSNNRKRIAPAEALITRLGGRRKDGSLLALRVLEPFAWAFALVFVIGLRDPRASSLSARVALAFAGTAIAYTTLATALVSYGDFSRYRFEVDALYLVVWAVAAETIVSVASEAIRRARARLQRPRLQRPRSGSYAPQARTNVAP